MYTSHKIDRILFDCYTEIFLHPSPINIEQEKKRVLEDKSYNPQFKYVKPKQMLEYIKEGLEKLEIRDGILSRVLDEKRAELIKLCNFIQSIGSEKLTEASSALYGRPDKELVEKAYKILGLEAKAKEKKYSCLDAKKVLKNYLIMHGFKWDAKIKTMTVGAMFDLPKRVIYINKNRKFSEDDIKRLVVHEVDTHVRRAENGKKQKYFLFYYGFPNYLETEEGLAVYNEEINGLLTNHYLRRYAGRVVAVNLALNNSFSAVYNELLKYFDKESALNLAIRAKRGLTDTSIKGGYTKDYIYLKGKYKVDEFVKNGGNVEDLYAGKIGIEHVPLIKSLI